MSRCVEHVPATNASLWTIRQGKGPPVVLCHGGPGLWDYLELMADMIDDLVTVYRYDQRACGRSSGGPPFDVASAVADLDTMREHWGLGEWIVAGHSWGATLALAYCLQHPDRARALIYISGTGIDPAWHAEYHANQAALLTPEEQQRLAWLTKQIARAEGVERSALDRERCEISWSTDIADRRRAHELARTLFMEGLEVNHEVNQVLGKDARRFAESEEIRGRLAALRLPALIVHGEADPRPAWAAVKLAELLPHVTLRILPAVGHLPWLERPELLREALRSFLENGGLVRAGNTYASRG